MLWTVSSLRTRNKSAALVLGASYEPKQMHPWKSCFDPQQLVLVSVEEHLLRSDLGSLHILHLHVTLGSRPRLLLLLLLLRSS